MAKQPMEFRTPNYTSSKELKNPMNRLDSQYDKMLGDARRNSFIWMIIAFILGLSLLLINITVKNALTYVDEHSKSPMIIALQPWGESVYMGDAASYSYDTMNIPEIARQWHVRDFLNMMRSISSDSQILKNNRDTIYSYLLSSCEAKVTDNFRKIKIGEKTVTLYIESLIKVSDNSYQLDWIETTIGKDAGKRRYRGVFTIEFRTPTQKQKEAGNYLGIFTKDFDFAEITGE